MDTHQLARYASAAVPFVDGLNHACAQFEISDGLRLQHFLAQIAHESAAFTRLTENLNYSAEGLLHIFPSHFDPVQANVYARDPESIADRAYADRMGNGDERSGDGWKYRGRGLIMITGRDAYSSMSAFVLGDSSLLTEPEQAASRVWAPLIAGAFWRKHGCNELADNDDLEGITRKVNGGLNGLADRAHWLDLAKQVFA